MNFADRWMRPWIVLGLIIFLVPLALAGFTGFSGRMMQDDYCYAVRLDGNFMAAQLRAYLQETTFAGNRYSLNLGMGLAGLVGSSAARFLPAVMLVLWLSGGMVALRRFFSGLKWELAALISAALIMATLAAVPNLIQVLYWLPGMFPYLAPLAVGTWLTALMAGEPKPWKYVLIFLLAWLTTGFSETGAAFSLVYGIGFLVIGWLLRHSHRGWSRTGLAAVLGEVVGIVLLLAAPPNTIRLQSSYAQPAGLVPGLRLALQSAGHFLAFSAYRNTLTIGFVIFFFLWLACLVSPVRLAWKKFLVLSAGILFLTGLAIFAVMFPSAYAEASYPADRSLLVSTWALMLGLAGVSWLTGRQMAALDPSRKNIVLPAAGGLTVIFFLLYLVPGRQTWVLPVYPELRDWLASRSIALWLGVLVGVAAGILVWYILRSGKSERIALLVLPLLLIQPIMTAGKIGLDIPTFLQRAALWDWRDEQIRSQAASGVSQVSVPALDSLAGIAELQSNPGYWVNHCAAEYYGVASIQAVEPVITHIPTESP